MSLLRTDIEYPQAFTHTRRKFSSSHRSLTIHLPTKGDAVSQQPTIIPIAAGKGGVGKTFVAANLSMALAEAGSSVIAVDLDLGGSNLHCHLGVPNNHPGIGDFLKARTIEFAELPVATQVAGLRFIPGDGKSPFMANIAHTQKMRLISRFKQLDADYVILDLGAGTSFNTLDFFALAERGLLVTQPEYPTLMNLLSFIKHFLIRRIERELRSHTQVRELLRALQKCTIEDSETSIAVLLQEIAALDVEAGKQAEEVTQRYRPRIIFNMGYAPDEMALAGRIETIAREMLCIELEFFGFVFQDAAVHHAITKRQNFLPHNRNNIAAEGILHTAQRIRNYWDRPVPDSARRIEADARRTLESFSAAGEVREAQRSVI